EPECVCGEHPAAVDGSDAQAAEIEALRAERDALLDALRQIAEWPDGGNLYGQEKIKRFAQHTIDAAINRAREEVDALAKDAAKYRWGINNARWIRSEQEAYVAIPVAPDADLSCVAMRDAAIDAALAKETS